MELLINFGIAARLLFWDCYFKLQVRFGKVLVRYYQTDEGDIVWAEVTAWNLRRGMLAMVSAQGAIDEILEALDAKAELIYQGESLGYSNDIYPDVLPYYHPNYTIYVRPAPLEAEV